MPEIHVEDDFTLADILNAQRAAYQKTGKLECLLRLSGEGAKRFYGLVQHQIAPGLTMPESGLLWNAVHVEVDGA